VMSIRAIFLPACLIAIAGSQTSSSGLLAGDEIRTAVETGSPELLGLTGLTVTGKIQPRGKPATYHFEYGPTQAYGRRTTKAPVPPRRTAYYHETWDSGWNGWSSWDSRLTHFAEGGAERGYIRYSGCPRDDHNHDDGLGTVHLAQYMYPGRMAFTVPSAYLAAGDPDFRDARIKIAVRGVDWQPNGTELMWWSQSQSNVELNPDDHTLHPGYIHANWCYTGTNLTDLLATGKWERAEYQLANDPHQWSYCGNVLPQTRYRYWSIDETQRHLNLDFFHMVVFVDPKNRPTGSIDFDEFEVAYRNYSVLSAGNGGKLAAFPSGSADDAEKLTDGWRNGAGKMWRTGEGTLAPLQFEYELARPVTIRAAQIHQHPEWPSREIEILVSADGQTWKPLLRGEMAEKHPAGPNFAFLLKRGLEAAARRVRVRILSGYQPEHWGLGEIELFGDGAEMTTDDDWCHLNTDITDLRAGETIHYRLVATNDSGTIAGNDHVFKMPTDAKPQVLTGAASRVARESAKVEGRINPLGKKTQFFFEYGRDATYGSKTDATYGGLQITPRMAFVTLIGLTPGTEYHYRLVATNETGTTHGADAVFRTK
jgi:hypothetical protein